MALQDTTQHRTENQLRLSNSLYTHCKSIQDHLRIAMLCPGDSKGTDRELRWRDTTSDRHLPRLWGRRRVYRFDRCGKSSLLLPSAAARATFFVRICRSNARDTKRKKKKGRAPTEQALGCFGVNGLSQSRTYTVIGERGL